MLHSADTNQKWIKRITEIIQENLENQAFGVDELARETGLSNSQLLRKLKRVNNKTAAHFIREIRLQKARELIHSGELTISEISYRVGFSSPTYFSKCFHEYFGYSPGKCIDNDVEMPDAEIVLQTKKSNAGHRRNLNLWIVVLFSATILVTIGISGYQKFIIPFWTDDLISKDGTISIVVMPFYNMTKDTSWNIWEEGVQECLITSLTNAKELQIRNKESVNALIRSIETKNNATFTPFVAGKVSEKLDASLFITGSVLRAGSILRIEAHISDSKTKEIVKSFISERPFQEQNVFQCTDTLSKAIKNFLLISKLRDDYPVYQHFGFPSTNSAEAFRYFIYGNQAASRLENARAIDWFTKALEIDSNYFDPMMGLSSVYAREGNMEKDYQWVLRYYKKKNQFSIQDQLWASWAYALSFEPPESALNYLKQIQQLDDQQPKTYYLSGIIYNQMGQYDKAIVELEKNLSICSKWGKDFMKNNSMYTELGLAYHKTGQFAKEKKLYKLGEKNMPDDGPIAANQAILYLSRNDTATARKYINKFIGLHKNRYQSSPAHITRRMAEIYQGAGQLDKAEELFRKSLSLEPDNPERMFVISKFFIETTRNLDEVPGLMDTAMTLARNKYDYYNYLETKGWSLYKIGRYKDALEILEKTWTEAPFRLHKTYAHLDLARKAVGINHS